MPKRELHNFLLLTYLLFGMLFFNVVRLTYISYAVDEGYLTLNSTSYYALFYLLASAMDGAGALIIASSPGWWVKYASINIFKCLIAAGILHLLGFILRTVSVFEPIYLEICFLILILEFAFWAVGGYGAIRRHRKYSNSDLAGVNSNSGVGSMLDGPKRNRGGR